MDSHDIDGIVGGRGAHRELVLFLVPILEKFPDTAAIAHRGELHDRILKSQQESRLTIHIALIHLTAFKIGNDVLDDAHERH